MPVHVHRALAYLCLLAEQGQSPDQGSLDAFAAKRAPRLAWRQPVTAAVGEALGNAFSSPMPPDPVTDYLTQVGWATVEDDMVMITALGEAVLRGLDARLIEEPEVADVALAPDEPLAWVHLSRTFGEAGAGMLVDAYFKADFLPWLLTSTSLTRVLVSSRQPKAKRDLADLGVALGTVPGAAAKVEIRSTASAELHDRCLIHADKTVQLLGASLTGVGKNFTAVIQPHTTIQQIYRELYERLWAEADRVESIAPKSTAQVEAVTADEKPSA